MASTGGMNRVRFRIVGAALGAVLIMTASRAAELAGQSRYPSRTVTLATHSSPGGGSDLFVREMAPHLSRILGVNIVVNNIQGGSGARAMVALARAKPDGSFFYATTPTFVYTSLLSRPPVSYTDLEPLVNVFFDSEVLYTAADSTFRTLEDVLARARSGRGRWGAANPASLERQAMERLKQAAGVMPVVATFEGGGDMQINVLNHTLDMGIGELQEVRTQLESGRLRLLAVVGDERVPLLPEVRTLRELGFDVSVRKFRGLAAPKGTPREIVGAWEAAVPRLLADAEYRKVYTRNGLQPAFMPQAEYIRFMEEFGRETTSFLRASGVIK